ncbi:hypothetical protein [Alkalihalobacillus sp. 1P02AB]|uniref:hypothetical protein n=1 Tax=Alkalihalobacillus sp. 1P02AB TaxID=3132260 RepID=UPI0039A6A6F1
MKKIAIGIATVLVIVAIGLVYSFQQNKVITVEELLNKERKSESIEQPIVRIEILRQIPEKALDATIIEEEEMITELLKLMESVSLQKTNRGISLKEEYYSLSFYVDDGGFFKLRASLSVLGEFVKDMDDSMRHYEVKGENALFEYLVNLEVDWSRAY